MLALKTIRQPFINLGIINATAAGNDVTLAYTERDFTTNEDLPNVVWKEVPLGLSLVEVRFLGTTNSHTYDVDVWLGRLNNNKAEMTRAVTLDLVCGQQTTDNGSLLYIDTINFSNENWIKALVDAGTGTDVQARFVFDLCGYDLLLFHGYGTFQSDLVVELSGYH